MDIQLRRAGPTDAPVLAEMNRHLIEDEGSRNPMALAQLEARLYGWLEGGWAVLLILADGDVAGYCVYQVRRDEYFPENVEVYLRQYFIRREFRGRGIGRAALRRIVAECCPPGATIVVDVLAGNPRGRRFWEQTGFEPYCTTMKMAR
jgi:GNAT superfamily N-acetyltransferase